MSISSRLMTVVSLFRAFLMVAVPSNILTELSVYDSRAPTASSLNRRGLVFQLDSAGMIHNF